MYLIVMKPLRSISDNNGYQATINNNLGVFDRTPRYNENPIKYDESID